MLIFVDGGKLEKPDKTLGARREPKTNLTNIWHRIGMELGPHWWEARALATAPSMLPIFHTKRHT